MKNMSKNLRNKSVTIPIIVASISVFCFFLQNPQIALSQCKLSLNGVIESTTGGFKFPDGTTQTTAGGVTITQQASAPTTMAQNDEVTVTHPSVTNHKMSVNVFEEISSTAQSDTSLDFDEADESNFTQEDSTNGTDFDSGVVTLHSTSGTGGIDSYTKLIPHMNSDFSDSSASGHTPTVNGATIDTSIKKFGAGSGKFVAASSQYVSYPSHSDFDFRTYTNSWTIDFWVYDLDITDNHTYFTIGTPNYECIVINIISSVVTISWSETGSSWENITGTIASSTWTHLAVVNDGGTMNFYIGGISVGSAALGANIHLGSGFLVKYGAHYDLNPTWYFNGNIDEPRVSKGIARWTSNFTPPTSAYSSPTYPTSQAYYITTASGSQIDTSVWEDITGVTLAQTTPTNTSLLYLVSFDGRTTWKHWTGSAWASSSLANLQTDGMNKTTLEGITQAQWGAGGGFTAGTLDFASDLKTTVSSATPSLDLITVNHNLSTSEMASTGKYGSSSDYGVRRKNATQTTFKKLSTGSANVYLNVFTY